VPRVTVTLPGSGQADVSAASGHGMWADASTGGDCGAVELDPGAGIIYGLISAEGVPGETLTSAQLRGATVTVTWPTPGGERQAVSQSLMSMLPGQAPGVALPAGRR